MKKNTAIILTALAAVTYSLATPVLRADEAKGTPPKAAEPAKPAKPAVKPYTLTTCIVSDEKLGEMGKPVVFEYKGQEIKLCCKACGKDFDKDPAKFLKKLEPKK